MLVIFCFIIMACIYLFFLADRSLLSILRKKSQVTQLEKEKKELILNNAELEREIKRAENDMEYIESIARKRNLVKKNEIIIDFSSQTKNKTK